MSVAIPTIVGIAPKLNPYYRVVIEAGGLKQSIIEFFLREQRYIMFVFLFVVVAGFIAIAAVIAVVAGLALAYRDKIKVQIVATPLSAATHGSDRDCSDVPILPLVRRRVRPRASNGKLILIGLAIGLSMWGGFMLFAFTMAQIEGQPKAIADEDALGVSQEQQQRDNRSYEYGKLMYSTSAGRWSAVEACKDDEQASSRGRYWCQQGFNAAKWADSH